MKDYMTDTPGQALLAPSDIAKLGDVSAAAVSNWRKRSTDFPQPAGGTDTRPMFARDDVLAWMKANSKPIVGLATSNAIAAMNLVRELALRTNRAWTTRPPCCVAHRGSEVVGRGRLCHAALAELPSTSGQGWLRRPSDS